MNEGKDHERRGVAPEGAFEAAAEAFVARLGAVERLIEGADDAHRARMRDLPAHSRLL